MSTKKKTIDPEVVNNVSEEERLNARVAQNCAARDQEVSQDKEAERKEKAARAAAARRRANRRAITRAVLSMILSLALYAAGVYELIAWQLAIPLMLLALIYVVFWAGAWFQFVWCKGGLLEWQK